MDLTWTLGLPSDLASNFQESSSAARQTQGEVDGSIASAIVQAHLAPRC